MSIPSRRIKKCMIKIERFSKQEGWLADKDSRLYDSWQAFQGAFYRKYGTPHKRPIIYKRFKKLINLRKISKRKDNES